MPNEGRLDENLTAYCCALCWFAAAQVVAVLWEPLGLNVETIVLGIIGIISAAMLAFAKMVQPDVEGPVYSAAVRQPPDRAPLIIWGGLGALWVIANLT